MQQRPPRAVDQGRRLLDLKLPDVSFTPYYTPARCLGNRDRNAPGANGKLDHWPVTITGKPDVERDVSSDAS